MKASSFLPPISAPHKTKQFWIVVAFGVVPILVPVVVLRLLGYRLFPFHVYITSGTITFGVWAIICWFIYRFGRIALLVVAAAMITFALWARSHG